MALDLIPPANSTSAIESPLTPRTDVVRRACLMPVAFAWYWLLFIKNALRQREWAVYRTNCEVYLRAQQQGAFSRRLALLLLDFAEHLGVKAADLRYLRRHANRSTRSDATIQFYSDDTIGGYAQLKATDIETQQRGLILPLVREAVERHHGGVTDRLTVVEIGTASGEILAHLASEYPECRFIGVDFSVRAAEERHGHLANVSFLEGYAPDMLEQGALTGHIVFANSTFVFFTPRELARSFAAMKSAGFVDVLLNEPSWGGVAPCDSAAPTSLHLEQGVWFHNWPAYLKAAGYRLIRRNTFRYRHPTSPRPDLDVTLAWGEASPLLAITPGTT